MPTSALVSSPLEQEEPLSRGFDRRHVSVGNHLTRALHLGRWPRCLIPGFYRASWQRAKSRARCRRSPYTHSVHPQSMALQSGDHLNVASFYTSSRLYYIAWEVYVWSTSCPPLTRRLLPSPRHEFLMRYWPQRVQVPVVHKDSDVGVDIFRHRSKTNLKVKALDVVQLSGPSRKVL